MGLEAGTTMITQQAQQHHQHVQQVQQQQQQQQHSQQLAVGNGLYNPPFGIRAPSFPNLPRQASIYSLTLDEFQNAISEPGQKQNFGSMNMDEFLRNIWTAEESQAMAAALAAGADQQQMGLVRQSSIQKQNSLTLPRTLSRKTVEEVWRDMIGQEQGGQQRQMTFGEMTLEDFLVKAGVVREEMGAAPGVEAGNPYVPPYSQSASVPPSAPSGPNPTVAQAATNATLAAIQNAANQQQAEWINYQLNHASAAAAALAQQQHHQQQQMLQHQAAEAAAAFVHAHKRATVATLPPSQPAAPLAVMPAHTMMERPAVPVAVAEAVPQLSPSNQANGVTTAIVPAGDGAPRGKKRVPGEVVEKVVERRQRRMIKNRESAARSRARKQAYTVELEAEIVQLKEENSALRRQQEDEAETRREKVLHHPNLFVCDWAVVCLFRPASGQLRGASGSSAWQGQSPEGGPIGRPSIPDPLPTPHSFIRMAWVKARGLWACGWGCPPLAFGSLGGGPLPSRGSMLPRRALPSGRPASVSGHALQGRGLSCREGRASGGALCRRGQWLAKSSARQDDSLDPPLHACPPRCSSQTASILTALATPLPACTSLKDSEYEGVFWTIYM